MSTSSSGGKGGVHLVSAQPSVREVPSSIPGVNTSLFQLFFFLWSFDYLQIPLKRGINGERGVKGAHRRPQVYQLLLLSRVIDVKYGRFTFVYLFLKPWGRGCKTCLSRNF